MKIFFFERFQRIKVRTRRLLYQNKHWANMHSLSHSLFFPYFLSLLIVTIYFLSPFLSIFLIPYSIFLSLSFLTLSLSLIPYSISLSFIPKSLSFSFLTPSHYFLIYLFPLSHSSLSVLPLSLSLSLSLCLHLFTTF